MLPCVANEQAGVGRIAAGGDETTRRVDTGALGHRRLGVLSVGDVGADGDTDDLPGDPECVAA